MYESYLYWDKNAIVNKYTKPSKKKNNFVLLWSWANDLPKNDKINFLAHNFYFLKLLQTYKNKHYFLMRALKLFYMWKINCLNVTEW